MFLYGSETPFTTLHVLEHETYEHIRKWHGRVSESALAGAWPRSYEFVDDSGLAICEVAVNGSVVSFPNNADKVYLRPL